jgi:hypothetical protein
MDIDIDISIGNEPRPEIKVIIADGLTPLNDLLREPNEMN